MKIGTIDVAAAVSASQLSECRFEIPIYQRLFVWDEERIERLLDDLQSATSDFQQQHYDVGIISVFEHVCDGEKSWEVVDGQQRLTFFTLLGCEFVRLLSNDDAVKEDWKRFVCCDDNKTRIHYVGREEDETLILNLLKGKEWPTEGGSIALFHKVFTRKYDGWDLDKLASWAKYCLDKVDILINELPTTYTPYDLNLYFEKMNATGRQLTPVEMVKGLWFAGDAPRWNACLNFDKTYLEQEKGGLSPDSQCGSSLSLCDIFRDEFPVFTNQSSDQKVGNEEALSMGDIRLVMRPEVFLLHVLSICKGEMDNEGKPNLKIAKSDYRQIVQTFKNAGPVDSKEFVDCLVEYRKWLDANIIYLERVGSSFDYRLRIGADIPDDDNKSDMEQFQAMLFVSSDDPQIWVLEAFCESSGGPVTLNILKKQDRRRHSLPALNAMSYGNIDRYWFWLLDYLIWKNIKERDTKNQLGIENGDEIKAIKHYVFRRNRSIEHLHPQTATDNEADKWGEVENSFGNLAMISVNFNSTQSNMQINAKLFNIKDQISQLKIESVKLVIMSALADGKIAEWNPMKAQKHGEDMYALLRGYCESAAT